MANGDYAKAVESLLRVIDQDKELVSETLEMLQTCYQQLGKQDEWVAFLRRCVEENTGATAELMLSDVVEEHEGVIPPVHTLPVSCSAIRRCASSTS